MLGINICNLHAGTCVQAGETDPEAKCDDDGNFEPLQCRAREEGDFTCVCVRPDGSEVEGTEGIFGDPDDAPDCDDLGMSYVG